MGIQDKSIGEVLKAIDEVKDLQNQTLSVLQDLQSEVQSLDAIKAQDRLKRYLKDLHNLTTYDPKATKSIEKEKTRIRTAVINTARDDLEAIDRALMGDTEPGITGVRRNGLLKHFYTRMYEKFEKDGGWSIPAFAQALDTYLFAAHQLQLHCKLAPCRGPTICYRHR